MHILGTFIFLTFLLAKDAASLLDDCSCLDDLSTNAKKETMELSVL